MLIISGSPGKDELIEAWEQIIRDNSSKTGDLNYDAYFQLLKGYAEVINEHTLVLCYLTLMTYSINFEWIEAVREKGYRIDTHSSAAYAKTLQSAKGKAGNLKTKAEMRRKEIDRRFSAKEGPTLSYEEIIGNLELALERTILDSENLTLAKYNVLKKGVEKKTRERNNRK